MAWWMDCVVVEWRDAVVVAAIGWRGKWLAWYLVRVVFGWCGDWLVWRMNGVVDGLRGS
jgi:hypothetical protein